MEVGGQHHAPAAPKYCIDGTKVVVNDRNM